MLLNADSNSVAGPWGLPLGIAIRLPGEVTAAGWRPQFERQNAKRFEVVARNVPTCTLLPDSSVGIWGHGQR